VQGEKEIIIQQPAEDSSKFQLNKKKRGGEWDHPYRKTVKTIEGTTEKVKNYKHTQQQRKSK